MGTVFAEMSFWTALTKESRDEDNILDQIYKQICSDFYFDDFNSLYYILENTNTTKD